MLALTLLFWLISLAASKNIKEKGVGLAVLLLNSWYLFPLFLYQILPFELPWKIDYWKIYFVLGIFMTCVILPFKFQASNCNLRKQIKPNVYLCWVAFLGSLLLWIDYFYLRGISIYSITYNRDILNEAGPVLITYIWIFCSALAVYNLFYWKQGGLIHNWKIATPLVFYSVALLIAGNRQYVFFLVLYYFFNFIITNKSVNLLKIIPMIIALGLVASLFFMIQFARQDFAASDQASFIISINQIACENLTICEFSPELTMFFLYLFSYFGNVYHGLTLVLTHNFEVPLFSGTATHLYSFYSSIFGGASIPEIHGDLQSKIHSLTGTFGGFWLTVFASFYMDFGYTGIALLYLSIYLSFLIAGRVSNYYERVKYYSFLFSLCAFGLMYSPTSELFLFILIFILLMRFVVVVSLKISKSQPLRLT